MDVSRLMEVLLDIEKDIDGGLLKAISNLVTQYTAARDSPTVDNATHIQTALEALSEHIIKGPFAEYPPSKEELLRGIGADRRVGPGVQSRVNAILSTHGQTTAALVGQLTALQSDINSFKKTCSQVMNGLKALGITPHEIAEGEFEVGVLIPHSVVDQKLGSLVKELSDWNKIVRSYTRNLCMRG